MDLVEANPTVVRAVSFYLVMVITGAAAWHRRADRACLKLAVASTLVSLGPLFAVNRLALEVGWWSFGPSPASLDGVPIDLWLSWSVLWGSGSVLLTRASPRFGWLIALVSFIAIDLTSMRLLDPAVTLGANWLIGEAVAVLVVLGPCLVLSYLTLTRQQVWIRAAIFGAGFGLVMFLVLPSMIFEVTGETWRPLLSRSLTYWIVLGTIFAPFGFGAVTSLFEFAERGRGTPVPHDPPEHLVMSGPYAYVANPMQLSMTGLTIGYGFAAESWAIAAAAVGMLAFSAGYAKAFEDVELDERYGEQWREYRRHVRLFVPLWKPYIAAPATLWVATSCRQCRQTGDLLEALGPAGVERRPAEMRRDPTTRMTFMAEDGSVSTGLVAVGRLLERVNVAWAQLGWLLRLPGISQALQLIADAAGAGPRELSRTHLAGKHDPLATITERGVLRSRDCGELIDRHAGLESSATYGSST